MTIDELREMIEGLPGDAEVLVEFEECEDFEGAYCVYLETQCNAFTSIGILQDGKPKLLIRTSPPDEVGRTGESPGLAKLRAVTS